MTFPALRTLDTELANFRPFVVRVAECLLSNADWGMKLHVVMGAILSILDKVTGINMIFQFIKTGHSGPPLPRSTRLT